MDETITLQFDGGSRGNPGPAGIGVVLRAEDGTPLVTLGRFIGRATNNVAEYRALITALQEAKKLGARKVLVRGDSELVVKQMRGEYRVKNPDLRVLYEEAQDLLAEFDKSKVEHNYRESNALADKLANLAMDKRRDVTDVDDVPARGGGRGSAAAGGDDDLFATSPVPPAKAAKKPTAAAAPPGPVAAAEGARFACPRCGCGVSVTRASGKPPEEQGTFVCVCGVRMKPEA